MNPGLGAAVSRLQTKPGAVVPGHALLIGSPLDDLGGVTACMQRVVAWLGSMYEIVDGPIPSTKSSIELQLQRMLDAIQPNDQVLVYYAGHARQWLPDPEQHDEPVTVLLPLDAHDATPASARLIFGHELATWLGQLARACERVGRSPGVCADDPGARVTLILECCHAAGLLDAWPQDPVLRTLVEDDVGHALQRSIDPVPRVVRVMATARDEIAHGPSGSDVGLMTHALVDLLLQHPGEPWWALWDRLRAAWTEPTQHPAIAGPVATIPCSNERLARAAGMVACRRVDAMTWDAELIDTLGWKPGQRVVMTSSCKVPAQTWGWVERDGSGSSWLRVPDASALGPYGFAWATRPEPGRVAAVDVWGGAPGRRAAVIERLQQYAQTVRDRESAAHPAVARRLDPRRLPLEVHHPVGFEVRGDEVVIHDRWGDVVARTSPDDGDTWRAWLDRLTQLDDWLELQDGADQDDDAFAIRWGTWHGEHRLEWTDGAPDVLGSETPLWIEVQARITSVPAYVSLFRIRADRSIQALAEHVPDGLPVTGRYREARWGRASEPLRLPWPDVGDDGPRCEELVVVISDQPVTLTPLAMSAVRPVPNYRGESWAQLSIKVLRYRLRR